MWFNQKPSKGKIKRRNNELKKIISEQLHRFKVCQCKYCGRWGATESLLRFKCHICNKSMALKKLNEPGLALKMYSFNDATLAGDLVRKLNMENNKDKIGGQENGFI